MNQLKPAQRFSAQHCAEDEPVLASPLQQRQQFTAEDFTTESAIVVPEKPLRSRSFGFVACLALGLLILISVLQWGLWLQQSWQDNIMMASINTVFSLVVCVLLTMVGVREWRLWRRLRLNQQWQQQAARIANSVQFGEASALCEQILHAMPASDTLQQAATQWRSAITAEHSDQEQLQLFDTVVLRDLDKQAQQLIRRASTDTSLAVAVSPFALADMVLVVWRSSRMLRALAALYGAPVGQLRSLAMLKRALAALLWAGSSELALDMASDVLGSELTAKLSARAGQGIIAGLLVGRLGVLAQQQLRPLPLVKAQRLNFTDLSQALVARFNAKPEAERQA
ncbi:TIGR01620 family protein [Alishewanella tabrizica]|uniref:TIGR01620 family protein n=1 Tax=Alishewanella tabrizica TaxID=671278 RepID=A0ABQ2WDL6_9ALTE|nr:TIGR01620 family protein [Alishewanella tabrizica]GGW50749.1 hypothetical protein GCM10008111_03360 [Alishewanella tabrizica]